ncbi:MAG: DNA modification methylase [Patescibacteria group bacterium]
MKDRKIKIEQVPTSLLKEAEYNPRKLTSRQEEDLTESIKKFGLADPLIVNSYKFRKNVIIGGHQRFKIAKKLGYKEVPVVYVNLNPSQEKEFNLRLNRNTGEWDWEMLKEFDIDLLLDVGFIDEDLSSIWDESLETEDDEFNQTKELEKIKKTDIKNGNIFSLGSHTLLCGDATALEAVNKLVGKEKINMIYNDPPYNTGVNYNKGIGGKKTYGGDVNDNKSDEEYRNFLETNISNALSVSQKDVHVFYYCDQRYIWLLQEIYKKFGIDNRRVCMWIKNGFNVTPQIAFNKGYEPCVYGTRGKPYLANIKNLNEILNKEIETGNRTIDDILDIFDIWLVKRIAGQEYEHPTQKPPTLHEKALRRCTKINDTVLDLFGGSGSTLIACEQLKRRCFIMEQNPIFCQLIINRFERYANKKAKKLG